jgi:hypothetical protein
MRECDEEWVVRKHARVCAAIAQWRLLLSSVRHCMR